jgi:UDP-N-acetylglucosamine:LPS N-acetylglucosamine transferase
VKGLNASVAHQDWPRTPDLRARMSRESTSPRVLVLTSGLGCGHVRAAEALVAAVRRLDPRAQLRQLDFWSLMNPGVAAAIKRRYLSLVLDHPDLYSRLHRLDEGSWRRVIENDIPPPAEVVELIERFALNVGNGTPSLASLLDWALGPYPSDLLFFPTACAALPTNSHERAGSSIALLRQALLKWAFMRLQSRMEQRLEDFVPDVVIATQMVPAALVSALKQSSRRWRQLPLIGVLTDFGAHDYWSQPGVDWYSLPHEDVMTASPHSRSLGRYGARLMATGVPLMPGFEQPCTQAAARARIGLVQEAQRPVVLVQGGGLGLGLEALVAQLQAGVPGCTLLVMAGRNAEVQGRIAAATATARGAQVEVRGWTEHMENYIAAADVVVGKPGGLSVAEVLACGRPLLVTRSLQGQESFNVQFLERRQVGALVSEQELPRKLAEWLGDPERLAAVQLRARDAGRRDGARRVARHALALAQRVPVGVATLPEAS